MITAVPYEKYVPETRTLPAATAPIGAPMPGLKSSPWCSEEHAAHGAER